MDQNFLFFAQRTQCYYPLLTPPLRTYTTTHTHTRVHACIHLHTNAAPDLSGPAKPIEGSWCFICHSNVFLGNMPAQGEQGYSGQDVVVYKRCVCVFIVLSYTSACMCLCA